MDMPRAALLARGVGGEGASAAQPTLASATGQGRDGGWWVDSG